MAEEKKVVTLDDFEQRLMVSGLMDFRNDLLRDEKPTEDINDLILKVIDAPTKKEKRRAEREERYDSCEFEGNQARFSNPHDEAAGRRQ